MPPTRSRAVRPSPTSCSPTARTLERDDPVHAPTDRRRHGTRRRRSSSSGSARPPRTSCAATRCSRSRPDCSRSSTTSACSVPERPVVRGRPEVVRPSVLRDGPRARSGPDQRADLQRRGLVARRHACATAHCVGRSGRRARPHQPDATRPRALPPRGHVRVPRGARRDPRRVRLGVRRGRSTRSSTGCGSGSTRTCRRHHPSGCRGATRASATRCSTTTSSSSS